MIVALLALAAPVFLGFACTPSGGGVLPRSESGAFPALESRSGDREARFGSWAVHWEKAAPPFAPDTQRHHPRAISRVKVEGETVIPIERVIMASGLRRGSGADRSSIRRACNRVARLFWTLGYAEVSVSPVVTADEDRPATVIKLVVTPGEKYVLHRLEIVGNARTDDRLIWNTLRMKLRSPYNPSALSAAVRRLSRLGTLDSVRPSDVDVALHEQERQADVQIHLRERKTPRSSKTSAPEQHFAGQT
jgi:hypothetical protein